MKQDFDAIGRLSKLYKDASTTYADTFGYGAAGQVTGFNYGNGVAAGFGYSAERLQLTSLTYTRSAQDLLKLNYYYKTDSTNCPNAPSGNNGQIQCIIDNSNTTLTPGAGGRSVTYTYDTLARLSTATTSGSTQFPAWGLSWTYDRYGNRTQQSIASGCTGLTCPTNSLTISASTNRINDTGYTYDSNGNLTAEPSPVSATYTYDAENRQVTATVGSGSGEYKYDGSALRVKKCVPNCTSPTTTIVYAFSGSKVVAEYENGAAVGSPTREYLYLGSQMVAKFEGGATKYYHQDHLSNRVITDSSGNVSEQSWHFPFGESPTTTPKWKFTSYERDSESGNDYAMFRTHINRFGRFSSPDLLAGSIADPQSLNRYVYVRNDPVNLVDPSGLTLSLPGMCMGSGNECIGGGSGGGGGGGGNPPWDPSFSWWVAQGCRPVDPFYSSAWTCSGTDTRADDGGTRGGQMKRAKQLAAAILKENNDCTSFFNDESAVPSQLDWGSLLSSKQLFEDPRDSTIAAHTTQTSLIAQHLDAPIFIHPPFFGSIQGRAGPYELGTLSAQIFIMLHEFAHNTGAIPSDGASRAQSLQNNRTIANACKKAIDALVSLLSTLSSGGVFF